jgi:hypothetical protein
MQSPHVLRALFFGAREWAVQQLRSAICLRRLAVMAREQTASNRYDSANDRERIEKEDEAIAKCVVSNEAVDQIGHVESPCETRVKSISQCV